MSLLLGGTAASVSRGSYTDQFTDSRYLKRIARYAAEREQRASRLLAELDVNDWFDYWHLHPDYKGRGNRVRPLFALLTYQLLQQAEALMAGRGDAVQVWAVLAPDTGNHGVYIHSENPAGNYPCDFAWVSWGVPAPEEVAGILRDEHEVGRAEGEDGPCYYLRRKARA